MYLKAIENGFGMIAFNNLGYLYYKQGKYDKAEYMYTKALEEGDTPFNNLGLLYEKQKKYDKAENNKFPNTNNNKNNIFFIINLSYFLFF
jgi:tetratricopeptide (TPR) repeat protein